MQFTKQYFPRVVPLPLNTAWVRCVRWLERVWGSPLTIALRRVKELFDPHDLMNSGAMFSRSDLQTSSNLAI